MNAAEAATLLALAAAFDNRKPSIEAAEAWSWALHDVPLDEDTRTAVLKFYSDANPDGVKLEGGRRWLEPHHVKTIRRKIRNARIATCLPPYDGDPHESVSDFIVRRREQIRQAGDGLLPPLAEQPALEKGPHPTVLAALAGAGRRVEPLTATELAEYGGPLPAGPGEQDRPALEAAGLGARQGRLPELAVRCPVPECRAAANEPCRDGLGQRMKSAVHRTRTENWAIDRAACPECQAAPGADCVDPATGGPYPHRLHPTRDLAARTDGAA